MKTDEGLDAEDFGGGVGNHFEGVGMERSGVGDGKR